MLSQKPIVWKCQEQNIHINKKEATAIKDNNLVFKEIFSKVLE